MTSRDVFRNTLIVLATLAGAYVLILNRTIIIELIFAIILASTVRPLVVRLMRWRVPEGVALLLVYFGVAVILFVIFAVIVPPVVTQFSSYIQDEDRLALQIISTQNYFQTNLSRLLNTPVILANADDIRAAISSIISGIEVGLPGLLGNVSAIFASAILVFVMGVYWLTSYQKAIDFTTQLFRIKDRERVREIILEIELMMGSYVRGVAFVVVFVTFANFAILTILQIPNAATLAFIIGVTTALPIIGGFIGGITATLLALLGSPVHGLVVLGTFVAVQQIETHYLTPRAMSRSIGVDPLLVIIAVIVGFTLYGVTGALLAVPVLGVIYVLTNQLVIEPRKANVSGFTTEGGLMLLDSDPETPAPPPPLILTS